VWSVRDLMPGSECIRSVRTNKRRGCLLSSGVAESRPEAGVHSLIHNCGRVVDHLPSSFASARTNTNTSSDLFGRWKRSILSV